MYDLEVRNIVIHSPLATAPLKLSSLLNISKSTIYRWCRWYRWHRSAKLKHCGKSRQIPPFASKVIDILKTHIPELTLHHISVILTCLELPHVHSWTISRELKRLSFTYKKLTYRSVKIDYERQINWWNNPPWGSIGNAGCFGIPTEFMIDIDECSLSLLKCRPIYGHSKKGTKAISKSRGREGIKYTMILAVDINVGIVSYWILPGNVFLETWHCFLRLVLFPTIVGQHRVLLFDNLRAHLSPTILNEIYQAGHLPLPRPQHSPHFSFVEGCFGKLRTLLTQRYRYLNSFNFIQNITECMQKIVVQDICGFAFHAHYYVPSRGWKPWNGD